MDNCLISNFNRDSIDITFSKEGDINSFKSEINKWLDLNKWFAKSEKESSDPLDWELSINKLFDILIQQADLQLVGPNAKEAIEQIRKEYLEKYIAPIEDSNQQAEIPQGDLPKKSEKLEIKLKKALDILFKGDRLLKSDFQNEFGRTIFGISVVQVGSDLKTSHIISDVESINDGIIYYLNSEYKRLYNFLKDHGQELDKFESNMFDMESDSKTFKQMNSSYSELLDFFFDYIQNNYTDISKALSLEFEDKYKLKDHKLLDSVYAFLNIKYFNDLLLNRFKDYIYINLKQKEIIDYSDGKRKYKYGINRRNSKLIKGWESNTVRDGLKELGTFSLIVMEQIPLINSIGYLTKNEVIISLLKLKRAIENGKNSELKKALLKTSYSTVEGWKEILTIVYNQIKNKSTSTLVSNSELTILSGDEKTQKGNMLTQIDLDNIESIYLYFFNTTNGLYYILREHTFSKGVSRNYDIMSSFFGSIRSTTAANYYEVIYDYDSKRYIGRIKSKNNSYNDVHNLIKTIRNYSIQNSEEDTNFNLDVNSGNVSYNGITIEFEEESNGIFNISSTKHIKKILGIDDKTVIDSYFRKQLNMTQSFLGRQSLLSESVSENELKFILLLRFIDKNLSTDFSTGDLGLQTLRTLILIQLRDDTLQLLFLNALRVASAKQLNIRLKERENKNNSNILYVLDLENDDLFPPYNFLKTLSEDSPNLELYEDEYWFSGVENTTKNAIFDDIVKAQKIINRLDSKATTKNIEGNSSPNVSVFFTDILQEFLEQGQTPLIEDDNYFDYITKDLLFSGEKSDAILSTFIDEGILTKYGEVKSVDLFSTSELFYHSFINKFVIPMLNGIFISLPITYSDKKKFLNFPIQLSSILGYKGNIFKFGRKLHLKLMMDTLGEYYKNLFKKVVLDYRDVLGITSEDDELVFFLANAMMKNMSEQELLTFVKNRSKILGRKIKFYKDLHYRNVNGTTSTNELLYYYINTIFKDENSLDIFLLKEKAKFVNQLLDSYTLIQIDDNISNLFKNKLPESKNLSFWLRDGYLMLASKRGQGFLTFGDKITESDILSGKVELNPLLETYFYLSNVINNNIKLGLVGHELHHKIKKLGGISSKLSEDLLEDLQQFGFDVKERNIPEIQQILKGLDSDLSYDLENIKDLSDNQLIDVETDGVLEQISVEDYKQRLDLRKKVIKQISDKVEQSLYSLLSLAQNALFKRTVAIPGTIRPFTLGKLDGITPTYNVAFIDDIKALVYDYKGEYGYTTKKDKNGFTDYESSKDEDAHDGSALLDPFTSQLENNSLDDSEVGEVKKPLWDIDNPEYGARGLIKYAVNSITNKLMLKSKRSNLKLHNLFKKMTDIKWKDGEIDLVKDWAIVKFIPGYSFREYIINDDNLLFYKLGSEYRKIVDFGKDESTGVYYTEEKVVNNKGSELSTEVIKVYHLFDANSNHYRFTELPEGWQETYKTINSLYRLHSALGGIYSKSIVEGRLVTSEASNKAVSLFMIYVSKPTEKLLLRFDNSKLTIKKNHNTKDIMSTMSQDDFFLPLKYKLINYVINDSAAKNGVSNINPRERYYDDKKLEYVTVSTKKYGILLDSDHEADEAELTEMTLVISALDATGLYHDDVYDIYNAIGEQIVNSLSLELEAIEEFDRTGDKNKLYDLVGKTIINNFNDREGMLKAVINLLRKVFNITTNHKYDKTLCPFSDASLYNKIIQSLGSVINKKGIKRTYPGSGMVMVPGYDIYQIWEIDGIPMQYEDVLNQAVEYNRKTKAIKYDGNLELYNQKLVLAYFDYKLPDVVLYDLENSNVSLENALVNIDPENVITINYKGADGKILSTKPISLNSVPKYYEFKFNTLNFLLNIIKTNEPVIITSIVRNDSIPRNLDSAKVKFTYIDGGIEKTINIFDSKLYKDLYEAFKNKNKLAISLHQSRIKEFLSNLEDNIYIEWDENGNATKYKIIKKDNRVAETIMSNIFRTNFDIREGDSLYDILKEGYTYFKKKINPLDGQIYDFDFLLLSDNGKNNIYISLDNENSKENYKVRNVLWELEHKNKVKIPQKERVGSKVLNKIYLIDDNNILLFEIGREIDVSDEVEFDYKLKKFIDKKTKQEIKDRKLYMDSEENKVVEYFEFITLSKIEPNDGVSFIRYNINLENLKKVLLPSDNLHKSALVTESTLNDKLSTIINDFYNFDSFLMIQPSNNIKSSHYKLTKKIFENLKELTNKVELKEYYENIYKHVFTLSSKNVEEGIKNNGYIRLNAGTNTVFTLSILDKYEIVKTIDNKTLTPLQIINKLNAYAFRNPELKEEIKNLIEQYNTSTILYWNQRFLDDHSKKKFVSFLKSLKFISSRIPALTLLSFMAMRCVGYTGVDVNYCAVSHFLTFLLGSDYDIDKSFMMGLNFDNSGLYYQWSDLFDYTSIETLEASEFLPLSKGYEYYYDLSNHGIDITKEANKVLLYKEHTPLYILAVANLLKYIYRHESLNNFKNENKVLLKMDLTNESKEKILNILKIHEKTVIPKASKDLILKNFISSHIQQISSKLGNLAESYTPVEMNDLREPAGNTPKSKLAQSLTLYNPAMINIMQFLNMSGKQVTGIAANGLKALFMWRTATLETLKKNKDIDMVRFSVELEGIANRNKYDDDNKYSEDPKIIEFLPDLYTNNEFYKEAIKQLHILHPKISSDNIGSQYISAATDNAKELILACINAGTKMAKCHLYLMSLGFDVADIVRFMTSDAVSFIDKITDENIFNRYNLDVNYAIEWAILYLTDPNDAIGLLKIPKILSESFEKELNKVRKSNKFDRFRKDLITLLKVMTGANEFSSFGRILGINLGVPLTKEDLMKWKNNLRNIIKNAEKKLINKKTKKFDEQLLKQYGISSKYDLIRGDNFDVDRWLKDSEYRNLTKEYYNLIKESLNIFYYIDEIPHFREMFRGLYVLNEIDLKISIKGELMNYFSAKLRDYYPYAPKNYEKRFEIVFNELFIERFIKNMNITILVDPEWTKFDSEFRLSQIGVSDLTINTDESLATFRYMFERYIIPKLQNGTLNIDNKELLYSNPDIREFLNGLVLSLNDEIPYYKANINMTLKDVDPSTRLKYNRFLKGMKALRKYKWGKLNISDLFILYNLIVNKNQYGSERLTEIFEDFITDFENKHDLDESYIMKYFRYLGKLDYYKQIVNELKDTITITDLLTKVAPTVRASSINVVKRSDPIVKVFSPHNGIIYYENVEYSDYVELPPFLVMDPGETMREYRLRQRNQYKYGFGLPYLHYVLNLVESLKSKDPEKIELSLDGLIKSGFLKYNIKCDE